MLRDEDMRSSFANAAGPLSMQVAFSKANDSASPGALTLQGKLVWSDAELGWVAAWQLRFESKARGRSIGHALLPFLLEKAAPARCQYVNIDDMESSEPALRVNDKIGFRPVKVRLELREELTPFTAQP